MNILIDLKAKADAHRDGKLDTNDLKDIQEKHPEATDRIAPLIERAAATMGGKIKLEDVMKVLGGLKDRAGDLFGMSGRMMNI